MLDSTPPVLTVGRRCQERGYAFHWPPYGHPRLVRPNGKDVPLSVDHYVPYIIPDVALPVMESCPSGSSESEGGDATGDAPDSSLIPEELCVGPPGETMGEFVRVHRADEESGALVDGHLIAPWSILPSQCRTRLTDVPRLVASGTS